MIPFVDYIFSLFTAYEKRTDSNKDVNDKGTLERFNETIGDDIDTNILPLIDNLLKNVIEPNKCFDRFIPYLEADLGIRLLMVNTVAFRRGVISIINRLHQIKGTGKCYEILFGMMGWSVVITEYFDEWGFDSPITLDDDIRLFDSSVCPACSDYSLALTGTAPSLTAAEIAAINSIIGFNEPINARIRVITYNGSPVAIQPDYNDDYSNDFLI